MRNEKLTPHPSGKACHLPLEGKAKKERSKRGTWIRKKCSRKRLPR